MSRTTVPASCGEDEMPYSTTSHVGLRPQWTSASRTRAGTRSRLHLAASPSFPLNLQCI